MKRILTIANQKGGVAKTTLAINLAAACARAGHTVLLIDFDPQGNAATFLGFPTAPGAYHLLAAYIPTLATLMHSDRSEQIRAYIRSTGRARFSLLPGSAETATAQAFILAGERDLNLIRRAILAQCQRYDIVICDTAPSLGGILEMAIFAGDQIVIPAACESAGIEGTRQTLETLKALTEKGWTGSLAGIVPTFHDDRTIERRESLSLLRSMFGEGLLPLIHESTAIRELPSNQLTIFEKFEAEKTNTYARRAAEEFSALARAVLRRTA